MTDDTQWPLVPKLRFPDFRDGPRWDLLTLSSVSDVNPSSAALPKSFIYIDLESVKNSMLIERKKITRDGAPSRAQRLLSRKDIIYQTVRPYQRNNFFFDINDGYEYVASTGYAQLRAHECPEFLYQLIHTDSFVNSVLARCTGSNYPAINPSALASISMALPRKPEQQKIADFLGSLDDLIGAKGRKLDALRQHKQGLMQKLFPLPGETQPILRFPKFRHSAEWQKVSLSHLLTFQNGYPFSSNDFGEERQGLRLIRNRDLRSEDRAVYYDGHSLPEFIVNDGDLLVGMDGVFTPCVWHKGTGLLNQRVGRVLPRGKHVLRFLGYLLEIHLKAVQEDTARTTVKHLSSRTVEGMVVHAPDPDEQQHIANCLSALDICICGQVAKLDALQLHKQGLLQQLFPSLEGR